MSLVHSSFAWLGRQLRWSNSRQSWEERLGALVLLAGGFLVWWYASKLDAPQQLVLAASVVALAAILLRRGWLKLFGPVLFYDMVRAARRNRYLFLPTVFSL